MRHQPRLTGNAVATTHGISYVGADGLGPLDGPDAALVAMADATLSSRIMVVSPGALEIACKLLQLGCTEVAIVRLADRPRPKQADIVLVPALAAGDVLDRAAAFARRVLAPLGTAVFRLDGETSADEMQRALAVLQGLGFSGLPQRCPAGARLLRADVPLFGRLTCA